MPVKQSMHGAPDILETGQIQFETASMVDGLIA